MKQASLAIAILVAVIAAGIWYARVRLLRVESGSWNSNSIQATYVGAQLTEVDPQHANLVLTYEVQNDTNQDYHLADAPGFVLMARLEPDHSLSAQQDVRLAYATFLPARQHARVALEIDQPFNWPAQSDPSLREKLGDLIVQKLANVEGYVLFDQANRSEIEFPSGWTGLRLTSEAEK